MGCLGWAALWVTIAVVLDHVGLGVLVYGPMFFLVFLVPLIARLVGRFYHYD